MGILNNGRTGLGGGAVGGMKALIRRSVAYATERKQFERPIAEFGMVREKIAQMTVDCFAAESAVWMVAHYIDSGCSDYSTEAAITKVFASEAMQRAAYEALQIAGGNGYMRELPYEQYTRDARILPIFEGANEILRLFIALSALKDVGASLSELKSALGSMFNEPIKGFGVLSGYTGRRFARATGLGSGAALKTPLDPELRPLADIYGNYARAAARVAEGSLRRYGKGIFERQYVQKRVADLIIDLFVGLCVISRAESLIASQPDTRQQVLEVARVFTHQARRRMIRNIRGAAHNEDRAVDALAGRGREVRLKDCACCACRIARTSRATTAFPSVPRYSRGSGCGPPATASCRVPRRVARAAPSCAGRSGWSAGRCGPRVPRGGSSAGGGMCVIL
jgi:hypothetical protein